MSMTNDDKIRERLKDEINTLRRKVEETKRSLEAALLLKPEKAIKEKTKKLITHLANVAKTQREEMKALKNSKLEHDREKFEDLELRAAAAENLIRELEKYIHEGKKALEKTQHLYTENQEKVKAVLKEADNACRDLIGKLEEEVTISEGKFDGEIKKISDSWKKIEHKYREPFMEFVRKPAAYLKEAGVLIKKYATEHPEEHATTEISKHMTFSSKDEGEHKVQRELSNVSKHGESSRQEALEKDAGLRKSPKSPKSKGWNF